MSTDESAVTCAMKLPVREVIWLWHTLSNAGIKFDDCQLNSQIMRQQITKHFTPRLMTALEQARDTQFLSGDDFRWIADDGRQPRWLVRKAQQSIGKRKLFQPLETLPIHQQLIAVFDLWEARLSHKKMVLREIVQAWHNHVRHDKLFTWFKEEDEQARCVMAWEWMKKHHPQLTSDEPSVACYSELLEFFDRQDATPGEKELYVSKIKRLWGTRKSRENSPNKKQCNFLIYIDVSDALDELAAGHEMSRTKILEHLIRNEAETGLHLGPMLHKV